MEPRFAAHAGASLIALFVALPLADASPKRADAKKLFDKALSAYGNDDFKTAVDALEKSYKLEADADTLFAWAQSERKLGDCAKAIDLYDKLLKYDLPQENREAVSDSRNECKQIIDEASKPKPDPTPTPIEPTPPVTPTPPATPLAQNKDVDSPFGKQRDGGGHAWWRDPIGDTFVLVGIAGVGIGTGFLVSASSASSAQKTATTFGSAQTLHDRADSQGKIGVISTSLGVAFVAGGIVWYATHRHHDSKPAVTGWIAPSGGGIAIAGGF